MVVVGVVVGPGHVSSWGVLFLSVLLLSLLLLLLLLLLSSLLHRPQIQRSDRLSLFPLSSPSRLCTMVKYPSPTRVWVHCEVCGIRLSREDIDVPAPPHESWCPAHRWRRFVERLCEDTEDRIVAIVLWRLFAERLLS